MGRKRKPLAFSGERVSEVAHTVGDMDTGTRLRERERELRAAHHKRRTPRYRSLVLHWLGRWFSRPLPAEILPLPAVEPGQVGISFAGHATVLIRYATLNIVCDPMLGSWVRGVRRAVQPGLTTADLRDVDLILISHAHLDHLHRQTLAKLPRSATVVVPPRAGHLVSDLGFARVVEIEVGQSIQDRGVDVITAPVRHSRSDHLRALSYVIRGDGPSVYFCGDSGYFSGFADIGERLRPDIALLPIGGYAPHSFRERHMSPLDALYALDDLGARVMIPIHHGAFALSYELLQEPARWLAELVRERHLEAFVVPLRPGESRVFVPPRRRRLDQPYDRDHNRGPSSPAPGFRSTVPVPRSSTKRTMHQLPLMRANAYLNALANARAGAAAADPWSEPAVALHGADADIDVLLEEVAVAPGAG